jgi:uncharacterized protein (TIGR03083 family)
MKTNQTPNTPVDAMSIPYVTAAEAYDLMRVELERFIALVETLDAEDWSKPTACTAWNVRDMLAHQAGGYASGTGYKEMFRQIISARPKNGQLPEDALNALQLSERTGKSPEELVDELRQVGPPAIKKWAYQFRMAKLLSIPHPVSGRLPLRHLMWVIHSRDTWMHRLDICRATHRPFEQTVEHNGRIAALVMRDVALLLTPKLNGEAIVFNLTGLAGGCWKVGTGAVSAEVEMDVLDFNIFASGRFSYEEALDRAQISGERALAERVMKDILILY